MQMQAGRLWPPSVKHLIVARLPHPGHHVDEELDPVGEYGESDQHPDAAVQVPDCRVVLEYLCAQKDGEAHHGPHEGVEPTSGSSLVERSWIALTTIHTDDSRNITPKMTQAQQQWEEETDS